MPDLEACYFCGAVEDVTREAALPATALPADATAPTVALCPECSRRLETVVAPLLDTAPPTDDDADDDTEASPTDSGVDEETDGVTIDEEPPDTAASSRPEGYGKVLRFLRNRELPMAEETVVELTITAYDLRREEVEAALEYAVDTGALVASDGEIRRP